jgi:hypothetical protein
LEDNIIEEVILKQLNDRKQVCQKLEDEIELLKGELEKEKKGSKFENSSKILDEIISSQRSPNNNTSLGYTQVIQVDIGGHPSIPTSSSC